MKKILLIEDDVLTAKIVARMLEPLGYKVFVAGDTYTATLLAHRERPELIIMDMMLPGGGGLNLLQRLKLSSHTRGIPVIALTAIEDEDFKQNAISKGVDSYMTKPVNSETLSSEIEQLIGVYNA